MLEERGDKITNVSACKNPGALGYRAGCISYTTRNYMVSQEAKAQGVDITPITKAVQRKASLASVAEMATRMKDKTSTADYIHAMFFNQMALDAYDCQIVEESHDRTAVEYHYCPLVAAWQKLGLSNQEIGDLCLSAMEGDTIMANALDFDLDIQKTIGCGHDCCRMVITTRKKA